MATYSSQSDFYQQMRDAVTQPSPAAEEHALDDTMSRLRAMADRRQQTPNRQQQQRAGSSVPQTTPPSAARYPQSSSPSTQQQGTLPPQQQQRVPVATSPQQQQQQQQPSPAARAPPSGQAPTAAPVDDAGNVAGLTVPELEWAVLTMELAHPVMLAASMSDDPTAKPVLLADSAHVKIFPRHVVFRRAATVEQPEGGAVVAELLIAELYEIQDSDRSHTVALRFERSDGAPGVLYVACKDDLTRATFYKTMCAKRNAVDATPASGAQNHGTPPRSALTGATSQPPPPQQQQQLSPAQSTGRKAAPKKATTAKAVPVPTRPRTDAERKPVSADPTPAKVVAAERGSRPVVEIDAAVERSLGNVGRPKSRWTLGGPGVEGEVSDLWAPHAYKIVNDGGWFIYSDSNTHELLFDFSTSSSLAPGDAVDYEPGETGTYHLKVYPGETRQLWQGAPNGWKYSAKGRGLSAEYKAAKAAEQNGKVRHATTRFMRCLDAAGCRKSDTRAVAAAVVDAQQRDLFVDLEFPPMDKSLGEGMDPVPWMRPTEYLPPDQHASIALYKDGIHPNDIDQGSLGDCWFVCSIAALAEYPEKIEDIFCHPHAQDEGRVAAERAAGMYRVTINKHGWWHHMLVDDYLPCVAGAPTFAHDEQDPSELWVALLEKAYARLHGGYSVIAAGDANQGLTDLTGFPGNRFKDLNEAGLFQRMLGYDQAGYLQTLGTPGEDDSAYMGGAGAGNSEEFTARYKQAGLGMGHAYSLIALMEFPQHGLELLKIRNPWGNGTEWTGDWGDESDMWRRYPDVAEACGFEPAEDGTFWMSWSDAKQYFDSGGVCFLRYSFHDYRVRGVFEDTKPNLVVEVTVREPTEFYLIIAQRDRRGLPNGHPDREYHGVSISVCQFNDGTGEYDLTYNSNYERIDEPRGRGRLGYCSGRDIAMKVDLEPRDEPYLILPLAHSSDPGRKGFVLGMIASTAAGEGFDARFKRPDDNMGVFRGYAEFAYDADGWDDVEAEWQYNPDIGVPETHTRSRIVTAAQAQPSARAGQRPPPPVAPAPPPPAPEEEPPMDAGFNDDDEYGEDDDEPAQPPQQQFVDPFAQPGGHHHHHHPHDDDDAGDDGFGGFDSHPQQPHHVNPAAGGLGFGPRPQQRRPSPGVGRQQQPHHMPQQQHPGHVDPSAMMPPQQPPQQGEEEGDGPFGFQMPDAFQNFGGRGRASRHQHRRPQPHQQRRPQPHQQRRRGAGADEVDPFEHPFDFMQGKLHDVFGF